MRVLSRINIHAREFCVSQGSPEKPSQQEIHTHTQSEV